mgnify:CR=1 FL=1
MKRYALLTDLHGNLRALEAVLADVQAEEWDGIFCLGDFGGYAAHPNEVIARIQALGIPSISGNYDSSVASAAPDCGCQYTKPFDIEMSEASYAWTLQHTSEASKDYLRTLAPEIRFEAEGLRVLLCHGSPRSETEYLFVERSNGYLAQFAGGGTADAQADVICFGHTHVPYHREVKGTHFINAGSVGRPKDGDSRACWAVLTLDAGKVTTEFRRVEYDVEAEGRDLVAAGLPEYFAEYLRYGGQIPVRTEAG